MNTLRAKRMQYGFTLVEIAIAIVILGLLLGGAVMTLTAQMDLKYNAETQRTLERAQEAILGFAAANGRLPCPGTAATAGMESPLGGGVCTNNFNGFVPAAMLALAPTDGNQRLVDAWGQPILYAVTNANSDAFTTVNGMRNEGLAALNSDLRVCSASLASPCSGASGNDVLTDRAVIVLASSGRNMSFEDNAENTNGNRFFIYRAQTAATDDIFTWTSPFTLYNRMLAAGAL